MRIAVFDFDGTITKKDTLLEFIKHSMGNMKFFIGFLQFTPLLVLMKLQLYPNWKAKEKIFSHFYKDVVLEDFRKMCTTFFEDNKGLVYAQAKEQILMHKAEGDRVVIVTASMEEWVRPFGKWLGVDDVLGTQLEIVDGRLTGRFATKNCYGQEKVNRLLESYPNRKDYTLVAYGDSRGDKELLNFADEQHYKLFVR